MKYILLATLLCTVRIPCAAAQGIPTPAEPANQTTTDCIDFNRHLNWKQQKLPDAFRKNVPASALVRMVQELSGSDMLVIYEKGNFDKLIGSNIQGVTLTDPNTQLVISRNGKIIFIST